MINVVEICVINKENNTRQSIILHFLFAMYNRGKLLILRNFLELDFAKQTLNTEPINFYFNLTWQFIAEFKHVKELK